MKKGCSSRGATSTVVIHPKAPDLDFSNIDDVELTFRQGKILLVKYLDECVVDAEMKTVSYHFTEKETLAFEGSNEVKKAPPVDVQLRFKIGKNILLLAWARYWLKTY